MGAWLARTGQGRSTQNGSLKGCGLLKAIHADDWHMSCSLGCRVRLRAPRASQACNGVAEPVSAAARVHLRPCLRWALPTLPGRTRTRSAEANRLRSNERPVHASVKCVSRNERPACIPELPERFPVRRKALRGGQQPVWHYAGSRHCNVHETHRRTKPQARQ